jgi:hypothetical protein
MNPNIESLLNNLTTTAYATPVYFFNFMTAYNILNYSLILSFIGFTKNLITYVLVNLACTNKNLSLDFIKNKWIKS